MAVEIHYDGRTYTALDVDMETALNDIYNVFSKSPTARGIYYVETPESKVALLVSASIPIAIEDKKPVDPQVF